MYRKLICHTNLKTGYQEVPVTKWDLRFLDMANLVASWSKDPSTQTGAVIVNDTNQIVSLGFNGFPRGFEDSKERLTNRAVKYQHVIHAEVNALLNSNSSVKGCTLYQVPMMSCCSCCSLLIQSGIKRVISPSLSSDKKERWMESMLAGFNSLIECGIEVCFIDKVGNEVWNPVLACD